MSTILRPNEAPKAVKNLGRLTRNWQGIEYMGFNLNEDRNRNDGELIAKYKDGAVYMTDFASLSVCWNFLDRPIFRDLPFRLVRLALHENNCQNFTIGDKQWKELNRLNYADFSKVFGL